jgi:hypothetical protein
VRYANAPAPFSNALNRQQRQRTAGADVSENSAARTAKEATQTMLQGLREAVKNRANLERTVRRLNYRIRNKSSPIWCARST